MEDLIEQNMGLVLTIVNRFNPKSHSDKEAYVQAGRIGLWKALTKFSKNISDFQKTIPGLKKRLGIFSYPDI